MTQVLDRQLRGILIRIRSRDGFRELDPRGFARAEALLEGTREDLVGHAVWHVNTSPADGVAELLRSLLGYTRDGGLDARWLIAGADDGFHRLSRRLYNNLYGAAGDGGELGDGERRLYEQTTRAWVSGLSDVVAAGDVVYLHDAPLAGVVSAIHDLGATVIWRCHLGVETPNHHSRRAWEFLDPYLRCADAYVFSRSQYAWKGLDPGKVRVIQPSIDPFSPKNEYLEADAVAAILDRIGLTDTGIDAPRTFTRFDYSPGRIDATAAIDQDEPIPGNVPIIAQVSGWERLKDQSGLIAGFAQLPASSGAHLVIAGPSTTLAAADSEERLVLAALGEDRRALPSEVRSRVHLVEVPMEDRDDNAAIVNAIQRFAAVVAHKPHQEGFGLSVAEAMWKARPIVASRVGGIPEQIVDGESGILVDPHDLAGFAESTASLLADEKQRSSMGDAARVRAVQRFSAIDHLADHLELIQELRGRPDLERGR